MYYSWYMGLCEFLRLLHHQYTFFFLKNQKKLHNAFLMNKLQQKNPPYVENMIHVKTHICKLLCNLFFKTFCQKVQ